MKPLKVEISDNNKIWGIYDVLQIGWNFHNHKIEWIKVSWYKQAGAELLLMYDYNFDGKFVNGHHNLFGRIIEEPKVGT